MLYSLCWGKLQETIKIAVQYLCCLFPISLRIKHVNCTDIAVGSHNHHSDLP